MNKREAKRIACSRLAQQAQADIDSGGMAGESESEADIRKIARAMVELRNELLRRAGEAER